VLRQSVSVVIPVYRAGPGLSATVAELTTADAAWRLGHETVLTLCEVVLVSDNPGLPDNERRRLEDLEQSDPRVRVAWLATNFGQHPATVAGIVSTNGDWVVTMDEDGQHDPAAVPDLARVAAQEGRPLVYASPSNPPPHGFLRNSASAITKHLFQWMTGATGRFHSFRLIEGEIARSACAYVGENVYLDVALRWSCGDPGLCPVAMRRESAGASSYNARRLASHFWRLVLSSGTRPLRAIAALGLGVATLGVVTALLVTYRRILGFVPEAGWTSVIVALLVLCGGLFLSVAILAEYVGFVVRNSIGKPVYVKVGAPNERALWRLRAALCAIDQPGSSA
jgi:glycosyltransferase involved in cell wall biosynthesis